VRLRDNTSSSVMTTDNLNLSGFEEVTVDFTFIAASMENGEDFWLQYSPNGGSTWQTLVTWASGTDFVNNSREFESVLITGTFSATSKFRFRCDASNNSDFIYIDDVDLSGCTNGTTRQIDESLSNEVSSGNMDTKLDQNIKSVNIYPNPAYAQLTVDYFSVKGKEMKMSLMNAQGQLIKDQLLAPKRGKNSEKIDLTDIESGIYFLHLSSEKQHVIKKIFVTK
jgi:hypothetical protein